MHIYRKHAKIRFLFLKVCRVTCPPHSPFLSFHHSRLSTPSHGYKKTNIYKEEKSASISRKYLTFFFINLPPSPLHRSYCPFISFFLNTYVFFKNPWGWTGEIGKLYPSGNNQFFLVHVSFQIYGGGGDWKRGGEGNTIRGGMERGKSIWCVQEVARPVSRKRNRAFVCFCKYFPPINLLPSSALSILLPLPHEFSSIFLFSNTRFLKIHKDGKGKRVSYIQAVTIILSSYICFLKFNLYGRRWLEEGGQEKAMMGEMERGRKTVRPRSSKACFKKKKSCLRMFFEKICIFREPLWGMVHIPPCRLSSMWHIFMKSNTIQVQKYFRWLFTPRGILFNGKK